MVFSCECGKSKIKYVDPNLKRLCNVCGTKIEFRDNSKQTTLNSLEAYQSIKDGGFIGNRHQQIIIALDNLKTANNRMIAKYLHLPINSVTPRVKELRDKGIVINDYSNLDEVTQRTTTYWKLI